MSSRPGPPLGSLVTTIVPARDKPQDLTGPIPWVRIEDFSGKWIDDSKSGQGVSIETIQAMNLRPFPPGTVACTCSCSMGTVAIVTRTLVTNQTFIGLLPRTEALASEYLYYALQAYKPTLDAQATGAIQQYLSRDDFRRLRLPLPIRAEQTRIVRYLDRETARIDALIEKKQRLIDLLAQRRTETIRTLVRSGITRAEMVAAFQPWIGEVPAHWDLLPLRRVGKLIAGAPFPDSFQGIADEELPYFKVADFETTANSEYMATASNTVSRSTATSLGSPVIPAGSVVFPKIGAALLSNRRRITRVDACMDQNVMALVVEKGKARFFFYLLQTFDFGRLRMPGPIPLFNERDAASLVVPVPPLDEQEAICRRLDDELPPLALAAEKYVASTQLLKEKRQAVITAAVNGLIPIPGAG